MRSNAPAPKARLPNIEARDVRSISLESLEKSELAPNDAVTYAARAIHRVTLAIGRATIAVRFARASAAAAFAERFGDMLGCGVADATVFVVDCGPRTYFWLTLDRAYCWTAAVSDELLVFFADGFALREYLMQSADLCLHAAVIARGSRAVALVGRSTAGKTTTALAAARSGFTLFSDERCIIQDGYVVPFLRAIAIREGSRAALIADSVADCTLASRLRALPARGDVAIRPRTLLGERVGERPARLIAAFMIESRAQTPAVERCSLHNALPAILRSLICRETGLERATRALAEFGKLKLYRLQLGTPADTARAIEHSLG